MGRLLQTAGEESKKESGEAVNLELGPEGCLGLARPEGRG